ncbi:PREDICTED: uncharacterized protein LOC106895804 isoform X2 [Calidris pugnax]|uniref:uncharacterized protein LOC106895804 isoform X2 n=1 Tax=Calidris pugnax TaxID=198806 RepID=UPI00071D0168|nr:PREDICTED: uncharacterized protein LOC106895804 isoform X2 [Calidris pugnax]
MPSHLATPKSGSELKLSFHHCLLSPNWDFLAMTIKGNQVERILLEDELPIDQAWGQESSPSSGPCGTTRKAVCRKRMSGTSSDETDEDEGRSPRKARRRSRAWDTLKTVEVVEETLMLEDRKNPEAAQEESSDSFIPMSLWIAEKSEALDAADAPAPEPFVSETDQWGFKSATDAAGPHPTSSAVPAWMQQEESKESEAAVTSSEEHEDASVEKETLLLSSSLLPAEAAQEGNTQGLIPVAAWIVVFAISVFVIFVPVVNGW